MKIGIEKGLEHPFSEGLAFFKAWSQAQLWLYAATVETLAATNTFVADLWADCLIRITSAAEGERLMDEVERDSSITINVGFGNITFYRDTAGTYAHAIVDLMLNAEDGRQSQIQATMRFACSPDADSVQGVVQKSREHLLNLLRSATARIEAESAENLLFQEESAE